MKASATVKPAPGAKVIRTLSASSLARAGGGHDLAAHIATAAYFKAQARGFEPGHDTDDWLAAEAELCRPAGQTLQ